MQNQNPAELLVWALKQGVWGYQEHEDAWFSVVDGTFVAACSASDPGQDSAGDSVETGAVDADGDGVDQESDCDDSDSELGSRDLDADCDGHLTEDDCDDTSAELGGRSEDADCDGTRTGEDCDDTLAELNHRDDDADGYSTCDGDCDDQRSGFNPGAVDTRIADRDCSGEVAPGSMSERSSS